MTPSVPALPFEPASPERSGADTGRCRCTTFPETQAKLVRSSGMMPGSPSGLRNVGREPDSVWRNVKRAPTFENSVTSSSRRDAGCFDLTAMPRLTPFWLATNAGDCDSRVSEFRGAIDADASAVAAPGPPIATNVVPRTTAAQAPKRLARRETSRSWPRTTSQRTGRRVISGVDGHGARRRSRPSPAHRRYRRSDDCVARSARLLLSPRHRTTSSRAGGPPGGRSQRDHERRSC